MLALLYRYTRLYPLESCVQCHIRVLLNAFELHLCVDISPRTNDFANITSDPDLIIRAREPTAPEIAQTSG
jgi:hypothetical protein